METEFFQGRAWGEKVIKPSSQSTERDSCRINVPPWKQLTKREVFSKATGVKALKNAPVFPCWVYEPLWQTNSSTLYIIAGLLYLVCLLFSQGILVIQGN